MNLEAIEQRCLKYLEGVANPVVPFETLLRHVQEDEGCGEVSRTELLAFVRDHELFRVLDPTGAAADPEGAARLTAAGLPAGPFVVLDTRIPSRDELGMMLAAQADTLIDALTTAAKEAHDAGDTERMNQVTRLMFTARRLRDQLSKHI